MNSIESWLTDNSIGKDLLARECDFLQLVLKPILGNDSLILNIGPVNIFNHIDITVLGKVVHVSESLPCDVISHCEYLPFLENSVDIVICHHGLEFFQDKELCIREISRILKPDGYLLICSFNPHRFWFLNLKWQGSVLVKKRDCLSVIQLTRVLKHNALQVTEGKFMFYTPLLWSYFNSKQIDFLEKAGDRWWPNLSSVYVLVARKKVLRFLVNPVSKNLLGSRGSSELIPIVRSDSSR